MYVIFMVKFYEEYVGSGMYIYISMLNNKGENVLVDGDGEDFVLFKCVLVGMIDLMLVLMVLLVLNVNLYCCFQLGMYVLMQVLWGYNNCIVVLCILCGEWQNYCVEYCVVGVDVNLYLVMVVIFVGILYGLDNFQLFLQEEVEGNGLE